MPNPSTHLATPTKTHDHVHVHVQDLDHDADLIPAAVVCRISTLQ